MILGARVGVNVASEALCPTEFQVWLAQVCNVGELCLFFFQREEARTVICDHVVSAVQVFSGDSPMLHISVSQNQFRFTHNMM